MTTRRPDMKTASFPAVVAAKKVASAQLNYYRTMMPPTIEEPLPAEPVQEPGDLMAAAQQFLNWNRSQTPPRVEVGFELGVFEAAIEAYTRRPTTEKSSVIQTAALGYWVGTTFVDILVTEVDEQSQNVGVVVFPKCGVGTTVSHFRLGGTIVELEYPLALRPEDVPHVKLNTTPITE